MLSTPPLTVANHHQQPLLYFSTNNSFQPPTLFHYFLQLQPFLSTIFCLFNQLLCSTTQPAFLFTLPSTNFCHPHLFFFRQQLLQPFFFQPIQPTVLLFHSTANLASLLFCHPLCQPTTTSAKQFHFSFHPVFLPSFPPPAIFLVRLFVLFLLQSLRGSSVEDRLSLVLVNSVTCWIVCKLSCTPNCKIYSLSLGLFVFTSRSF